MEDRSMKKIASFIAGALVFGLVAGGSMVGINVAAQRAGLISRQGVSAGTEAPQQLPESTAAAASSTGKSGSTQTAASTVVNAGSVSEVAQNAMPSVVAITNMMQYQANGYSMFGQSQTKEAAASGSGVIIGKTESELLIVTNNHVVTDSNSLSVTFADDKAVAAQIKGTDATADLAVISVKLSDIPTATLNTIKIATIGSSDAVQVGDQVVAIGNALGYGQSVTTGIISAKNRDVETEEGTESGLLQTDAAINPGNSGGALLNMKGELIGINVAKYSSTDVEGMGYSIPSAKFQSIIDNLSTMTTRETVPENERGYLGVQVKNIDKTTSETYDMPQGVFIYRFTEGSSAQNSGLQEKDILTKFDGQGISSYDNLQKLLAKYRAGETVKVTVQRMDGSGKYQEVEVEVTLGSSPQTGDASSEGQKSQQEEQQNPFQKPGEGGSGNDGSSRKGGSGSEDEELWRQFEEFFQQYRR